MKVKGEECLQKHQEYTTNLILIDFNILEKIIRVKIMSMSLHTLLTALLGT